MNHKAEKGKRKKKITEKKKEGSKDQQIEWAKLKKIPLKASKHIILELNNFFDSSVKSVGINMVQANQKL